jgi:hypothetical protein
MAELELIFVLDKQVFSTLTAILESISSTGINECFFFQLVQGMLNWPASAGAQCGTLPCRRAGQWPAGRPGPAYQRAGVPQGTGPGCPVGSLQLGQIIGWIIISQINKGD